MARCTPSMATTAKRKTQLCENFCWNPTHTRLKYWYRTNGWYVLYNAVSFDGSLPREGLYPHGGHLVTAAADFSRLPNDVVILIVLAAPRKDLRLFPTLKQHVAEGAGVAAFTVPDRFMFAPDPVFLLDFAFAVTHSFHFPASRPPRAAKEAESRTTSKSVPLLSSALCWLFLWLGMPSGSPAVVKKPSWPSPLSCHHSRSSTAVAASGRIRSSSQPFDSFGAKRPLA